MLGWVGSLGKIVIGLTVVAFFWGLFQFIAVESQREEGKHLMGWSFVAVFIMVSLWGLIKLFQGQLGVTDNKMNVTKMMPQ